MNVDQKAITLLETLAQSIQNLLIVATKGDVKNRAIVRLAKIDQMIAERKQKAGIPNNPDCAYLGP